MHIDKNHLIYYGVPALIAIGLILIVLLLPVNSKQPIVGSITPTAEPQALPTIVFPSSTGGPAPTDYEPQGFTGVNPTQTIPQQDLDLGTQKTKLRKLTPLVLPFGSITFNYETDQFVLKLASPDNQVRFEQWLLEQYPSIPISQFAIQ